MYLKVAIIQIAQNHNHNYNSSEMSCINNTEYSWKSSPSKNVVKSKITNSFCFLNNYFLHVHGFFLWNLASNVSLRTKCKVYWLPNQSNWYQKVLKLDWFHSSSSEMQEETFQIWSTIQSSLGNSLETRNLKLIFIVAYSLKEYKKSHVTSSGIRKSSMPSLSSTRTWIHRYKKQIKTIFEK